MTWDRPDGVTSVDFKDMSLTGSVRSSLISQQKAPHTALLLPRSQQ